MTEEERAAQFRADHIEGARKRVDDRYRALPPPEASKAEVAEAWGPLIDRTRGWDVGVSGDEEPQRQQTPVGPVARGQGREIL